MNKTFRNFFTDKNGKLVIWQSPNILLYGWLFLKIMGLVVNSGDFKSSINLLASAFIFAWAYLEITDGVNLFRRFLGSVVILLTVISYFRM